MIFVRPWPCLIGKRCCLPLGWYPNYLTPAKSPLKRGYTRWTPTTVYKVYIGWLWRVPYEGWISSLNQPCFSPSWPFWPQDFLTGAFLLTQRDVFMSRDKFCQSLGYIGCHGHDWTALQNHGSKTGNSSQFRDAWIWATCNEMKCFLLFSISISQWLMRERVCCVFSFGLVDDVFVDHMIMLYFTSGCIQSYCQNMKFSVSFRILKTEFAATPRTTSSRHPPVIPNVRSGVKGTP